MNETLAIDKNTVASPVPTGQSSGLFDWFGRLFVPDAVEKGWIENDAAIRERARNDASSKEIQARIDSSAAMAKSADSVRAYTSAPFVGDVLTGEDVASAVGDAAAKAPSTLLEYVSNQVVDPLAKTAGKTVQSLVPWQLWLIVGVVLALGVGIFAYVKGKS